MLFTTLRLERDFRSTLPRDLHDPVRDAAESARSANRNENRPEDSPTLDSLLHQLRGADLQQFQNPGCE